MVITYRDDRNSILRPTIPRNDALCRIRIRDTQITSPTLDMHSLTACEISLISGLSNDMDSPMSHCCLTQLPKVSVDVKKIDYGGLNENILYV